MDQTDRARTQPGGLNAKREALWSLLFLLIAACTVWAVSSQSKNFSLEGFLEFLQGASMPWLVLAFVCMLLSVWSEGMALLQICRGFGHRRRASDGFIYMRAEYACFRPLLLNAIRQAKNYGFLGTNILGRGFDFDIHLYSGAGAYVCGEGTARIRSSEGKAGRPRMKPPFIKVSGVFARPTCLNNVETLSLVPHLLLDDAGVYASCGSDESIGTKLISVAGNVNRPGVFEIPFGTTVREILYDLAGGIQHDRKIQLIQFGGASGKIADASILDTPYTYEDLRAAGVMVGSGGMLVIDERTSVLDFLRMNQEFFWEESCGQCTPCREGNLHIKIILDKMAAGTATREDIAIMMKIARVMSMSSLCGLGETAQNSLLSAMKVFPDLFDIGGARA